jgi:parallel beta-helix repeat protein
MKRIALSLTFSLALLSLALAEMPPLVSLTNSNSPITMLEVSAQSNEQEVIHKEITITPDGNFIEEYLCENGTWVHNEHPNVPISKNIFGNYYTFTGNVHGHLVIERNNIIVDGAGHKLQLEGYRSFAISVGTRDRAHSNTQFVGTNNVVITNMVIEDLGYGIELAGSNNVVSGVTLTGGGDSNTKAIWDSGSNNIIRECKIIATEGTGIYVAGSGAIITDNYIADNGAAGIEFPGSAGMLRNNRIVNNRMAFDFDTLPSTSDIIDSSNMVDGKPVYCLINEHDKTVSSEAGYVLLSNCTNITVQDISILNRTDGVVHNSNGIYLYSTRDSLIRRNYLQVGAGVTIGSSCQNLTITGNYVGSGGITLTQSSNVSVTANKFQAIGISLISSAGSLVFNNTFSGCTAGMSLRGAYQNRIQQNRITNCDVGINIFKSDENVFSSNDFINNKQDVREQHLTFEWTGYVYHESVHNIWDGNFWSNYTGKDANRDGIGDTPHIVYEDKRDNFPLISEVDIPELILEPTNSSSPSDTTDGSYEPLPSLENITVAVTVVVIAVAAFTGLLLYFKKRKHFTDAKV